MYLVGLYSSSFHQSAGSSSSRSFAEQKDHSAGASSADRLHVSQPPFSKQIHDLEGELGIDLFKRRRKGVALSPAGKSLLIDARRILEDCEGSIRKAQRISRGEIGELAIGYMSGSERTRSKAFNDIRQLSGGHTESQ
jgi:Bacterial regulatory helix-turn-helix protein, lysR family